MNALHRVVLDASTLVSAALRVGSVPHRAFMRAASLGEVCVSQATLISSDADLRVLHPWRDIPIITPQDYLLLNE